jgi:16S rRNA (guanine527-N7)-methyltransferase
VSQPVLADRIAIRLAEYGFELPAGTVGALAEYLALLAHWNRRVNLTAFDLSAPTDAAIDRLIIEPVAAATYLLSSDEAVLDIGSGGGSPAIPLKLIRPALRMTLVESRGRKAAFLSEAVRHLSLVETRVETSRFEDLANARLGDTGFDVVTIRAVGLTSKLGASILRIMRPAGRVFWFGGESDVEGGPAIGELKLRSNLPLLRGETNRLLVLGR